MENTEWGPELPETPPPAHKKLSPGQLAYRKAQAKKGLTVKEKPVVPVVEVTQAKAAMLRKQAKAATKAAPTTVAPVPTVATCSVCGKPLTRPASAAQGQGDICAAKVKLLPAGETMADHYETLSVVEVPEGFMLLKEAIALARTKGCSGYRFIQACGGDRMLRPPFNEHFKVVFVQGKRYVSRQSLKDLECLKKV